MLDRDVLWREVLEMAALPSLVESDEITITEFVARTGSKRGKAQQTLDRLVEDGAMTKRVATMHNGRRGYAYRLVANGE